MSLASQRCDDNISVDQDMAHVVVVQCGEVSSG